MTGKSLANPLRGIVAAAVKQLPAVTGGTDRIRRRLDDAGSDIVVVADVSSSMAEPAGDRRKIDVLRDALATVPQDCRMVAFSSVAQDIRDAAGLPAPAGGTALDRALDHAGKYRPRRTIVISDGEPDNEAAALAAAGRLSGVIDVIYCGRDGNARALDFMRRLARAGGGAVVTYDISRQAPNASVKALAAAVARLALPAPE
jgi:Mg-chelatase subunit ChlD